MENISKKYEPQISGNIKTSDLQESASKYSIQNKNDNTTWEQHLEKNNKTTGTRTDMLELKEHIVPLLPIAKAKQLEISKQSKANQVIPTGKQETPKAKESLATSAIASFFIMLCFYVKKTSKPLTNLCS